MLDPSNNDKFNQSSGTQPTKLKRTIIFTAIIIIFLLLRANGGTGNKNLDYSILFSLAGIAMTIDALYKKFKKNKSEFKPHFDLALYLMSGIAALGLGALFYYLS